jgi:serine/threonine-protein kinase
VSRFTEGQVLGDRYELLRFVAAGGMADVWRANDLVLGRAVAVKIMRPSMVSEPVFAARFREEAVLTAGLAHHNIATLFDYGTDLGIGYLVMEFVEGDSLSAVIRNEGPLPPDRVRSIIGQMAMALGAAHDAGVVHRDIKPANVLLTESGYVKLTDFGIARATNSAALTRTGETLGTPHYLSPEQALGKPATTASDIYALGVVAHELLTGRRPFDKETPVATAMAHLTEPMPTLPANIPTDLTDVISKCLAKDPTERPIDVHAVARAVGVPWVEIPVTRHSVGPGRGDLPIQDKLVDLLVPPMSEICVLSSRSARTATALADLGHRVVGVSVDHDLALGLAEASNEADTGGPGGVQWTAGDIRSLTREALGSPEGFDCVLWAEGAVLELRPGERAAAMRAVARLCAQRGRVVVEFTTSPAYEYTEFRDDFLSAGMVPDLLVSGWDLRPVTPDSTTSIVVLSRR